MAEKTQKKKPQTALHHLGSRELSATTLTQTHIRK